LQLWNRPLELANVDAKRKLERQHMLPVWKFVSPSHRPRRHDYDMNCCEKILAAAGTLTPCDCTGPGFCPRHASEKNDYLYLLCRTRLEYFEAWERGEGPLQHAAPPIRRLGLGDIAHYLIAALTLGRVKMCPGCASRRAAWNRLLSVSLPTWPKRPPPRPPPPPP
jgi:hypothetical protein